MKANEAIDQLVTWVDQSDGHLIEVAPGNLCSFASFERFTEEQIGSLEFALGWPLPATYRAMLQRLGRGELFIDNYGLGLILHSPTEVIEAGRAIWEGEEENSGDRFCFIGANTAIGDYFGFVMNRPGPMNFDVFCHEYPPFEYTATSDELKSWRTLDEWLIRIVKSFGQDCL